MALFPTKKLKIARENRGYTQLEALQLFNVEMDEDIALSTWQKWEQGVLACSPDKALMLSRFFKVDLKELVVRK
jgi:transcriptional regulator with XRE-family HTH domain